MLHLHTLGAAYISRDSGEPLGGVASQRRLIALLAILAVAGDAGMTREEIVAILWPDVEIEKGRHSLTQALYQARRALACDDLFVADADVRLNFSEITSDLRQFEAAVAAGDLAEAVSRYRGDFLGAFYLPGNSAFDRWADGQRQLWRSRLAEALDRLASEAAARRDFPRVVQYRQRLASLDPLDSRAAMLLVEGMRDAGNVVGAMRQLQLHETLLRSELDMALPPELVALRRSLCESPLATERDAAKVQTVHASGVATPPDAAASRGFTRSRRWRRAAVTSALTTVAAAAVVGLTRRGERAPVQSTDASPQPIVVAPFRTAGADPSLHFLREGLVELISLRIGGDSARPIVDPGTVIGAWQVDSSLGRSDLQAPDAMRLAGSLGARSIIVGSVVGNPRHLIISAQVVDVADSTRRSAISVEGPLDSLSSLVDRISGRLLIASAGEAERFRREVTPSPQALLAFLDGLASYRRGNNAAAVSYFETATRLDSGFALGGMYLALAADKLNSTESHGRGLYLAWSNRNELAERDRLLLTAFAGPRFPGASTISEQLAAWEAAVAWSPGRTDALLEYAERLARSGRLFSPSDPLSRADRLLRHVLRIDPENRRARELLLSVTIRTGGANLPQVRSAELPVWAQWAIAQRSSDERTLRRIRADMTTFEDADLTAIARLGQFLGQGMKDVERALDIRRLRARRQAEQVDAILAQHSLALNEGKRALALSLTEQLEDAQPGLDAHLRLRVLDGLYGDGDSVAAVRAAEALAERVDGESARGPSARAVRLADACVLGQWRVLSGAPGQVEAIVSMLRTAEPPRSTIPVSANPHVCADLLEVAASIGTGGRRGRSEPLPADSLVLGGPAAGDVGNYGHMLIARMHERTGHPERALAAIKRRPFVGGWPRYLATARREEGRLAQLSGDPAAAMVAYQKYLLLRDTPDTTVTASLGRIRGRVRVSPKIR